MSNSNSSSNRVNVPEAREAMDKFKYEVASEIGVPLKQGYNGDLTSAQNGYVGGYMVKKMFTQRHRQFHRNIGYVNGQVYEVKYDCNVGIM